MLTMTSAAAAATHKDHIIRLARMPAKSPQPEPSRDHPHAPEWPQRKRVNPHDAAKQEASAPDRSRERRAVSAHNALMPGGRSA